MLPSPSHAVVGSADLERMTEFFRLFGFEQVNEGTLPAESAKALYDLDGPTREVVLGIPGAKRGWLRLVETPHRFRETGPFDSRPIAIDLYSMDIVKSLEIAAAAGVKYGELVEYEVGPYHVKEAELVGPEHVVLVFIEANIRRPSILETDPDRLHSEVHSLVWAVTSAGEALPAWTEEAGLQKLIDTEFGGPTISRLMELPKAEVPVRFVLMCDADQTPARFEFIEFLKEDGAEVDSLPLAGGLHAAGFNVENIETAMKAMVSVQFGQVTAMDTMVHPDAIGVTGLAPGGVRFELWQERES